MRVESYILLLFMPIIGIGLLPTNPFTPIWVMIVVIMLIIDVKMEEMRDGRH